MMRAPSHPDKNALHPPGWLLWLLVALSVLAAWPVVAGWSSVLLRRELAQNVMPLLAGLLLIVAMIRSVPHPREWHFQPDSLGLAGLILAAAAYLAGGALAVKSVFWGSYILIVASVFTALFGRRQLLRALPVFLFAFFLLPEMPTDLKMAISLPLQLLSTQLTTGLAGLFIPVTSAGNLFYINGDAFEVTVACSGLHTWLGFLFAGLVWMLFRPFRPRVLLAVLIAAPLLAIGLNTLRLFITAIVAHQASADTAIAIHTQIDYLLFPAGLIAMWTLEGRLYENE